MTKNTIPAGMEDHSGMAPAKYPNLGMEYAVLHDHLDTVEYAVNLLRSGSLKLDGSRDPGTLSALYTCINDLVHGLQPRFEGVIDALLLAHRAAGGSWNELATAADTASTTMQSRVKKAESKSSVWVDWARGDLNPHVVRHPVKLPGSAAPDPSTPYGRLRAEREAEEAAIAAAERAAEPDSIPPASSLSEDLTVRVLLALVSYDNAADSFREAAAVAGLTADEVAGRIARHTALVTLDDGTPVCAECQTKLAGDHVGGLSLHQAELITGKAGQ
ncbi:hypothetical protein ACI2LF_43650 [Kribbella sp. NPDC020789]